MYEIEWQALILTMKLAASTTVILMLFGIPLAWWLARKRSFVGVIVESLVALPVVLPPTVLGFYLLMAFSPETIFGGGYLAITGQQLAFSFEGILIGSLIYSLPFAVQPLQTAFSQVDFGLYEAARSLGASPRDAFMSVVLPISRGGVISAAMLCFAHTVGEFGVVLMIGGSIPGETQVLSIALFDAVESLQFERAHLIAGGLLLFSIVLLIGMSLFKRGHDEAQY